VPIPIDEVHRLIDLVERGRREVDRARGNSIQVEDLPAIVEAVIEISGWVDGPDLAAMLSINASVLNKFVKVRGADIGDSYRLSAVDVDKILKGGEAG
jgi:hypothetical protein